MDNKRRDTGRKTYGLPVRFWILPKKAHCEGQTANVSPGGLFIHTEHDAKEGEQVTIEVDLPGRRPMQVRGSVVWARLVPTPFRKEIENGFGVRIDQAPEDWFRLFLSDD